MQTPRKRNLQYNSPNSTSPMGKTPQIPSMRIGERKSPRSPASEKKHLNRTAELESRLSQIQEELQKTKDELASSELQKKKALLEADEAKKYLTTVKYQLEESKRQVQELCDTEDERIYELRKLGKERDRAWQSELEAVRKRHSVDSAALLSAMHEIQRLKLHCDMAVTSETAHMKRAETAMSELQALKKEMVETRDLMENLKIQVEEYEKSEVEYQESINVAHLQLDMARTTIDTLQTEAQKLTESFKCVSDELEVSKAKVSSLEETVAHLQAEASAHSQNSVLVEAESARNLTMLRCRMDTLQSVLETAEMRYLEEHILCIVQTLSAYEAIATLKTEFSVKEAEYEPIREELQGEVVALKAKEVEQEDELKGLIDLCKRLNAETGQHEAIVSDLKFKLQRSMEDIKELRADLMDKENELQCVVEENSILKLEKQNRFTEIRQCSELPITEKETNKSQEQDAQIKTEILTKGNNNATEMADKPDSAQADQMEMEAELRRLRIQTEQWKKAAEVAMALIAGGENGGMLERTESFDYSSYRSEGKASPFVIESDSLKKPNNMIRRIGVLLKKSQK